MLNDHEMLNWILRIIGSVIGAITSLIMIAPEGTRNAFYRFFVSFIMGIIFAPMVAGLPMFGWLEGATYEHYLARGAAASFPIWFILEGFARVLSSTEWMEKLATEVLRLKKGDN